ncbi:MAG: hypothetical protein HKN47_23555 [Pirellulaceae bacterium]|nr:hypothetical protein [Pirellulaceae bacterium]
MANDPPPPNPYQAPLETSEYIDPAPKPVVTDPKKRSAMQEAIYFGGVWMVVFVLAMGMLFVAAIMGG